MPPCVITDKDHLEFVGGVLHVNGQPHPSLKGCTFKGDVHFSIPIQEVSPKAAPQAAPVQNSPLVAPQLHVEQQPYAPPPAPPVSEEIAQIQEVMQFANQLLNMPPLMAVGILAAFVYMKMKKQQGSSQGVCTGHAQQEPRLAALEAQHLDRRLKRVEDTKALIELMRDEPPKKPAEHSKDEA